MFNMRNFVILVAASVVAAGVAYVLFHNTSLPAFTGYLASSLICGLIFILSPFTFKHSTEASSVSSETAPAVNRETGKVKWFDSSKGYGFIHRDSGDDIFVHFRSIRGNGFRSLNEGQHVEFSVVSSERGPQAEDILILDNK